MMKNLFWFVLLAIGFGACNDDDGIELAEIPFIVEYEIPAGLNTVQDHFFEIRNIPNVTEQVLAGRGVDIADVGIIQPKSARLTVIGANSVLSFIDECSISLFDESLVLNSEAFWTPQIRFDQGTSLDVPGTLIDAKEFLEQEKINLEIRFDTRSVNSEFINIRMDVLFSARGK